MTVVTGHIEAEEHIESEAGEGDNSPRVLHINDIAKHLDTHHH